MNEVQRTSFNKSWYFLNKLSPISSLWSTTTYNNNKHISSSNNQNMSNRFVYFIYKFFFIYFLFFSNILFSFALYTDNLNFNPYIVKYDKINYDRRNLNERHSRVRRSLDNNLFFNFNSHGREFKLKLNPSNRHSYASRLIEINSNENQYNINDLINFYDGYLVDEPHSSHVSGSIIDGVFYGTINSNKFGKYFIEPSKRYNHTLGSHSIIYNEKDINFNQTRLKQFKRSVELTKSNFEKANKNNQQQSNDNDEDIGCGSSRNKVKDWMKREQEALYTERVKQEGYDPYSYIETNPFDEYSKYSREANENYYTTNKRSKRETNEPERLRFPGDRTICNLYLRVDPQLHTEIFNNEGNKDPDKTTTFILFYLNKHVEALNSIYNSLPFYDANKEKYLIGLQFMIYRTKIITEAQCRNKTLLSIEEQKLCEPYLDVSTFLNYVSLDNFTDYCLSYTFTARDFTDGTLGLAWVAKLAGSVGGVCEKRQTLQNVAKSLNSGIVTVVNYQARVPEAVSQITFAHEVGHNFGSEHDPDDSNCSPGTNKGGNYIMYRRATTGTDKNNRNFSQCSRDQMGPIVHALVSGPKFCFKQYSGSLCGNGIVEEGEECDCGYGTDCKESCCIDASQEVNKCKLKPGKACSPSQGPCCDNSCNFATKNTICMQNNECLNNVYCSGKNATCPRNDPVFFKPDKTECNSGTQVCKSGVCSGSICEKFEMEQCFIQGNLKDKRQDKSILCHLACIGEKTDNQCVDSFEIPEMTKPNSTHGLVLKPGSPCVGTLGYCDIFSKCRAVDAEGPLARLKNILLNPKTLSSIRTWITTYWWAASLIVVGSIIFMVAFIKVCSVHTPSSNPRKPPALKISDTLRRPIKRYHSSTRNLELLSSTTSEVLGKKSKKYKDSNRRYEQDYKLIHDNESNQLIPHPHWPNYHHHQSATTSADAQETKTKSSRQQSHLVNEKHSKQNRRRSSSNSNQQTSDGPSSSHHKKPMSAVKPGKKTKEPITPSKNQSSKPTTGSETKERKTSIFSKRHKSNEPIHYYNSNHPLHPMPHKSSHNSSHQSSSQNQAKKSSESKNRSKSADNHSSAHQHSSRSESERRSSGQHQSSANNNNVIKKHDNSSKNDKKSKTKSASPSKHHQRSEFISKTPSGNQKVKTRKRSSTESSSVDA